MNYLSLKIHLFLQLSTKKTTSRQERKKVRGQRLERNVSFKETNVQMFVQKMSFSGVYEVLHLTESAILVFFAIFF